MILKLASIGNKLAYELIVICKLFCNLNISEELAQFKELLQLIFHI